MCAILAQAATIDVNGTAYPVDTLEHYQVGPGTMYTRFNVQMGTTQHRMYLLTVDMTNPHIKVEEAHGDHLGATKLMTKMHQDIDSAGHRPIGSVNCNFWVVASQAAQGTIWEGWLGQSFSGTAKDGMLLTEPMDWNEGHGDRGYVMVNELNQVLIRNMYFSGRLIKGTHSRKIKDVNRPSVNPSANEVCLYNRHIGTTRAIADSVEEYIFVPVEGQTWTINDTMTCVVLSKNNTGRTTLTGDQGALQCRGTGKTFMTNHIAVGDTFQIKLGVYSGATSASRNAGELSSADSIAPRVMQMVTGNCLVMANGVLTHRNTNEGYNNQNYPRTMLATNNDGSRLWMLVSEKPGNYTAEMCGILKNDGATWAAGMDGGGSAQMNLFGSILNPTTEASPRAVANAFFVVSTAPDDGVVARLESKEPEVVELQAYTTFVPSLRAYNQYGNLLTEYTYSLSVSPASLGTVSADGMTFTAGPLAGSGVLTVTSGTGSIDLPISVEAGEWQMRLDSVVVDHRPYTLEVLTVGDNPSPVPADVLAWTSEDETIATVTDGVVTGVANGRTTLTGMLGDRQLTQVVDVQIPDAEYGSWWPHHFSLDDGYLSVSASTGFDPVAGCIAGNPEHYSIMGITFTYSTVRAAFVRFETDELTWGLADSLIFMVESTCPIKTVEIHGHANNATDNAVVKVDGPSANEQMRIAVSPAQLKANLADRATYPFHLTGMRFLIDTKATAGEQTIRVAMPYLHYEDWQVGAGFEENALNVRAEKIMRDGQVLILRNGHIYNALGQEIK